MLSPKPSRRRSVESARGSKGRGPGHRGPREAASDNRRRNISNHKKKSFIQANYRFVLHEFSVVGVGGGGKREAMVDVDAVPCWEDVAMLIARSPRLMQCPICLEPPQIGICTECGHIYCFLCILRYMEAEEKKKCPVCSELISRSGFRPVAVWKDICSGTALQNCVIDTCVDANDVMIHLMIEGGAGALSAPDIPIGSQHQFQHVTFKEPGSESKYLFYDELTPLFVDLKSQLPTFRTAESVFSRLCIISCDCIIGELGSRIDDLAQKRVDYIKDCDEVTGARLDEMRTKPPEYARVAAGLPRKTNVDASPIIYPGALQGQLSLISEAVHIFEECIAFIRERSAEIAGAKQEICCKGNLLEISDDLSFRYATIQSCSGLDIYLHPICSAVLDSLLPEAPAANSIGFEVNCSKATLTHKFEGRVVDVERVLVTSATRKKFGKLFQEIPVNVCVSLIHIDMIDVLCNMVCKHGQTEISLALSETKKIKFLRQSGLIDTTTLETYIQECRRRHRIRAKTSIDQQQQQLDYRLAQELMVKSLIDIDEARKTKAEVIIQDLLSGPVVGYSYEQDGPMADIGNAVVDSDETKNPAKIVSDNLPATDPVFLDKSKSKSVKKNKYKKLDLHSFMSQTSSAPTVENIIAHHSSIPKKNTNSISYSVVAKRKNDFPPLSATKAFSGSERFDALDSRKDIITPAEYASGSLETPQTSLTRSTSQAASNVKVGKTIVFTNQRRYS